MFRRRARRQVSPAGRGIETQQGILLGERRNGGVPIPPRATNGTSGWLPHRKSVRDHSARKGRAQFPFFVKSHPVFERVYNHLLIKRRYKWSRKDGDD